MRDAPPVELIDPADSSMPPPGTCLLCRAPLCEIRTALLLGGVRGWPCRLGARLPAAADAVLMLDDGTRIPLPLCRACAAAPGDLGALWAVMIHADAYNLEQRVRAGAAVDATPANLAGWRRAIGERVAANRARRPIALVAVEPA